VAVNARPIDPRDQTWELWEPTYRVYLWEREPGTGWRSAEFELSDCDGGEAMHWAKDAANGRVFTVYAVVRDDRGVGLIRVAGDEPTRT
jgi:hypothetical protein